MRGYEEEIAAEGQERLSEEDKWKLSDKLLQVKKGMEVTVCYFEAGDGQLTSLDISTEPALQNHLLPSAAIGRSPAPLTALTQYTVN